MERGNGQQHQSEICRRPRQSHPRRASRVTPLPERVEGCARPTEHGVHGEKRKEGNHNHAPGFAPHVRDGIERNLSAKRRRFVATDFCDERMRGFVAGGGKQKGDIPDESEDEKIGCEVRQGVRPFRMFRSSRLEVVPSLCKPYCIAMTWPQIQKRLGLLFQGDRSAPRFYPNFPQSVLDCQHGDQEQKEKAKQIPHSKQSWEGRRTQAPFRQEVGAERQTLAETFFKKESLESRDRKDQSGEKEEESSRQTRRNRLRRVRTQGSRRALGRPVRRFTGFVERRPGGLGERG